MHDDGADGAKVEIASVSTFNTFENAVEKHNIACASPADNEQRNFSRTVTTPNHVKDCHGHGPSPVVRSLTLAETTPNHVKDCHGHGPSPVVRSLTLAENKIKLHKVGPKLTAAGALQNQVAANKQVKNTANMFLEEELAGIPMFQTCSEEFLDELCCAVRSHSHAPGHTLAREGSSGGGVLFVMRGTVNMYVDKAKVQQLNKGAYVGETILLGIETAWKFCLRAESACTVNEIHRDEFYQILERFPKEYKFFEDIREKHSQEEDRWVGTIDNTIDLLSGMSEDLRRRIDDQLVRRMYFPSEKILVEGTPGDELYMLVRGTASVEMAGRVVRVERRRSDLASEIETTAGTELDSSEAQQASAEVEKDDDTSAALVPVCFGELGLLGLAQVRSADVRCLSVCQVRVLYRSVFLRSLEEHGECLKSMASFFEKRYNTDMKDNALKLKDVKLFKEVGCSEDFLDFLAKHLEDRMYLSGMKIIDENLPDDKCMYLITSGSVKVTIKGVETACLGPGAVVGEVTVLGLATKRTSSVIATETCHTQVLHQSIVVRGLELFPDERQKVLMMAFKKQGLADDENDDDKAKRSSLSPKAKGTSTHRAFMKVLKASPLFSSTSEQFVDEIEKVAFDRIYMPGDAIIEQGAKGDSMFIMVSGQAGVFVSEAKVLPKSGTQVVLSEDPDAPPDQSRKPKLDHRGMSRVGTLHAGSITGELAMLGVMLVRSATIEAETICSMWEITQEQALIILERFPEAQKRFSELVVKHLDRTVPARLQQLNLLRGFERKFRTIIGLYCAKQVFFPGQIIVREGRHGTEMFVINLGKASLEKKGVAIKTLIPGNHFGSTLMLGIDKVYFGTLLVTQTCHLLVISRSSYLQALDHYPSTGVANQLKISEKKNTEELKEIVERVTARKFIWKRYQGLVNPEGQDASDKVHTDAEMILSSFQGWVRAAGILKQRRKKHDRERNQYRHMMEHWVKKKREGLKQMKKRQEEEQALMDAVCPYRQRAIEEKSTWEPQRGRRHRKAPAAEELPPVRPFLSAATPDSAQLVELLKEWPTPRPSPFYNLKVWYVIAESLEAPGSSPSPLLPLLTGPPNTAATDPAASAGPLCASPPCDPFGADDDIGAAELESECDLDAEDIAAQALRAHSYTDDVTHGCLEQDMDMEEVDADVETLPIQRHARKSVRKDTIGSGDAKRPPTGERHQTVGYQTKRPTLTERTRTPGQRKRASEVAR